MNRRAFLAAAGALAVATVPRLGAQAPAAAPIPARGTGVKLRTRADDAQLLPGA